MTPQASIVSVIIVTYNSASLIMAAIRSVERAAKHAGVAVEMIVVDNDSPDDTVDVIRSHRPEIRLVCNEINVGFGRANNQAFQLATGDVWLLLNPDAVLDDDALSPLLRFLAERPAVGAVAPVIESPWDGGPESGGMTPCIRSMAGHFLFVNRLLPDDRGGPWRGVMLQRRRHLGPRRVEWLSGTVLLLRPEAVRSVGGFDSRFFLYSEDVDLGTRLCGAGWELWTTPDARARHVGAGSQGGVSIRWVDAAHEHFAGRAKPSVLFLHDLILATGMTVRALVWSVASGSSRDRTRARIVRSSAWRAWQVAFGVFSMDREQAR
ncbi:MAG: glycosyltransferase family 2 protein [Actinomycetota bacterium]|nr:glycosyltransferase family 2 protein [Actinomycetota bacterium]